MPFDLHWRHIKVLNEACRRDTRSHDGKALYTTQKEKVGRRGKFTPGKKKGRSIINQSQKSHHIDQSIPKKKEKVHIFTQNKVKNIINYLIKVYGGGSLVS